MKAEIECKLTKKQLKILNDTFCVYENGTKKGEIPDDCDKCILREIKWVAMMADQYKTDRYGNSYIANKEPIIRDLCFAIYHDGILTNNPKHYHHNF